MRSTGWRLLIAAFALAAALAAGCAEEHDHSTHTHDDEGSSGAQSMSMDAPASGHAMAAGLTVEAGRLLWVVGQRFEYEGCRIHELGFYFSFRRPHLLVGDHMPIEPRLEYAWFPVDRLPDVKPSFLVEALAEDLPRAARYIGCGEG